MSSFSNQNFLRSASHLSEDKTKSDEFCSIKDDNSMIVDPESYLDLDITNDVVTERTIQLADYLQRTSEQLRSRVNRYSESVIRYRRTRKRRIPPRVAENIFIITFVLQLIWVAAIQLVDTLATRFVHREQTWFIVGIIICVIFQLSNLFLSLAVTVKLTKQYMHHTATTRFLLQSYMSTLFIFGGIYTFIAREWPSTFDNIRGEKHEKFYVLRLYSQLLFTSISTGTLCGAASVVAIHWVTEIMMAFQMMLSFVYFASILSQVVNPPSKPAVDPTPTNMKNRRRTKNNYQTFGSRVD